MSKKKHWTQTREGKERLRENSIHMWKRRRAERKVINAEVVHDMHSDNTIHRPDHDALVAILDNVWHGMSVEEKVALLDPRDPSNPEGL